MFNPNLYKEIKAKDSLDKSEEYHEDWHNWSRSCRKGNQKRI